MTRRNRRDTVKGFDDVEVEHRHRVARLLRLGSERQPQEEARVWRRHQLLERRTASETASKMASMTAVGDQRLVEKTADDYLRLVEKTRQHEGGSE